MVVVGLVLAGCYNPAIPDCAYSCVSADSECPSGLTCDVAQHACRIAGATGACAAPGVDGGPTSGSGCADGTREGFTDGAHPNIAACQGAWTEPGLSAAVGTGCTVTPGNSGSNRDGSGCAAADLCAPGWHICASAAEVSAAQVTGDCDGHIHAGAGFFATNQVSGLGGCGSDGTTGDDDDIIGCSSATLDDVVGCTPLTDNLGPTCDGPAGSGGKWSCSGSGAGERATVTKGDGPGGVLCCVLMAEP